MDLRTYAGDLRTYAGLSRALAVLLVATALSPVEISPVLRTVVAAPFVLFLPGYAVLNAVFAEKISGARAFAFSVGLSLAIIVITGLVLDAVYRLTPLAWALALSGITLAFVWQAPIALMRIIPADPAAVPKVGRTDRASMMAACVFAVMALFIARNGALNYKPFEFSELWLVPSLDLPATYTVGISNQESAAMNFDLRVTLSGKSILNLNGIEIEQGGTWITDLPVALAGGASNQRLEAWLSRSDQPSVVYRNVWLTLNPQPSPTPQKTPGSGLGQSLARAAAPAN